MKTQTIAETMDSAIQRLENLKSKDMHQLIPNTYTICESAEQCKELFELAKANGVKTTFKHNGNETVLIFSHDNGIYCEYKIKSALLDNKQISLPEFISRLKGEYEEGVSVTLPAEKWHLILERLADAGLDYPLTLIQTELNKQQ